MKRIILMFLVLTALFCSACSSASVPSCLELNTTEKIKTVFYDTEDLFAQAAEGLECFMQEERVHITREKENTNADAYVVKEINGLYIEASAALSEADFQSIYEACAPLFSAYDDRGLLRGIAMYGSRVEFVIEGPVYGNAAELFYFSDEAYGSSYMSQTEGNLQIAPHWYAEICHY